HTGEYAHPAQAGTERLREGAGARLARTGRAGGRSPRPVALELGPDGHVSAPDEDTASSHRAPPLLARGGPPENCGQLPGPGPVTASEADDVGLLRRLHARAGDRLRRLQSSRPLRVTVQA